MDKEAGIREKIRGAVVRHRFKHLKSDLNRHGVMIGEHKRVSFPKSVINENDLSKHLGMTKVTIAVPESGQKRFSSYRHHDHNYHIHDHGKHWTMHRDSHASVTMALKKIKLDREARKKKGDKDKGVGSEIARSAAKGAKHVLTEGIPGAAHYVKNRATGASRSVSDTVWRAQGKKLRQKYNRWSGGKKKEESKKMASPNQESIFKTAGFISGMNKAAKITYQDSEKKPRWYHFDKNRGPYVTRQILHNGKEIGHVGYIKHPEGHAEINHFFIDSPEHRGKGHGRRALGSVMKDHGEVISDTKTGTTAAAQRAMHGALKRNKNVRLRKIETRELSGKKYKDMNDEETKIFHARKKGRKGLSRQDLKDIEHNSKYHRQRRSRALKAGVVGAIAGGIGGAVAGHKMDMHDQIGNAIGAGAALGGLGTAWAAEKAQRPFQKKHMRGNW